jgi:hypothetical protein
MPAKDERLNEIRVRLRFLLAIRMAGGLNHEEELEYRALCDEESALLERADGTSVGLDLRADQVAIEVDRVWKRVRSAIRSR